MVLQKAEVKLCLQKNVCFVYSRNMQMLIAI